MILNSAVIERYLIDGKTYEDTKEFIDALLACDDLVADVYVNYKRVTSGPLSLSVNNSWIIANVDERMSITNMDGSAYVINIVVHQLGCDKLEDVIMKSTSPLSTFIDPGDIDADLYFAVMATVPECTQECHVPESEFNMMGTNNIVPKDFTDKKQCPDDPTIPEPETPTVMYTLQPYGKEGYIHAIFTMSNVDYDQEGAYTWVISPPTAGKFNINGTGNSAIKEYQNPDPEDPEYKAIVAGTDITATVMDDQENILFEDVTATLVD
jgi:hypothetical protein